MPIASWDLSAEYPCCCAPLDENANVSRVI
jgi:hypothetical protein